MKYTIILLPGAEKSLEKLPDRDHDRILDGILSLADNPWPPGSIKLTGRQEHRLRAGDYRVLYTIDDKNGVVTVVSVGHRREVYR